MRLSNPAPTPTGLRMLLKLGLKDMGRGYPKLRTSPLPLAAAALSQALGHMDGEIGLLPLSAKGAFLSPPAQPREGRAPALGSSAETRWLRLLHLGLGGLVLRAGTGGTEV